MRHGRHDDPSAAAARVSRASETTPEHAELILVIGSRRGGASPASIAIEADCVAAWRRHSFGSAKSITPTRNAVYGREISTGHRTMAVRDLCEAIADGGAVGRSAARAALEALASALDEAEKSAVARESRDSAIAEFARESSEVSIARLNNESDARLLQEVDEAIASGQKLKAVIVGSKDVIVGSKGGRR